MRFTKKSIMLLILILAFLMVIPPSLIAAEDQMLPSTDGVSYKLICKSLNASTCKYLTTFFTTSRQPDNGTTTSVCKYTVANKYCETGNTGSTNGVNKDNFTNAVKYYKTSKTVRITCNPTVIYKPQPKPQPQPTPVPQPQPQPTPVSEPQPEPGLGELTGDEQQMIELINQERARYGLSALKVNMELVKVARLKAKDMVDLNYFSHTSPTYGSPFDMMKKFGITYLSAGENLAGASSVEIAHQNLMNSSGHRANILNSSFTEVGVGVVEGSAYGKIFVQMFIGR